MNIDLSEINLLSILIRIGSAILIFLVGLWLARYLRRWLQRTLVKAAMTESLIALFSFLIYYGTIITGLVIALGVIGVPVSALVSTFGVFIIILGIALQESIGNLAATVIFLIFQPFKVGDLVESGNILGTVREIQLFSTALLTGDNKLVVIPNSKVQENSIINYSHLGTLRVDLDIRISYNDDLARAKQVLASVYVSDPRIFSDPAPNVVVRNLDDSSVVLSGRGWVKSEDYWVVRFALIEQIKLVFDREGITIHYPQRVVHFDANFPLPEPVTSIIPK
jgi:small conductance mechanosensitive channel